jgi:hypothetical protein
MIRPKEINPFIYGSNQGCTGFYTGLRPQGVLIYKPVKNPVHPWLDPYN